MSAVDRDSGDPSEPEGCLVSSSVERGDRDDGLTRPSLLMEGDVQSTVCQGVKRERNREEWEGLQGVVRVLLGNFLPR